MLSAFGNTALILLVAIAGTVLIGSMAAYAIDRFTFRFKKLVVALFLVAALVPGVTTQVATFQIVNSFGMFDTLWAPIALYMGTDIVSIYIFLQFVRSIPASLDEAARIDGAGMLKRFRYVVLPHLRPTIVAAVIIELLITLQLFDLIYALTLGGPGAYSTYNLYFYAYKNTFEYQDFGYGAVLAYVVSALVIVFALILTRWRSARGQLVAG